MAGEPFVMREQIVDILNDVMQLNLTHNTEDIDRTQVQHWDSVNHLRLVLELESAFSISLSDSEVIDLNSLHQIMAILQQHGVTERLAAHD